MTNGRCRGTVALVLLTAAVASGCTGGSGRDSGSGTDTASQPPARVAVVIKGLDNPFFIAMRDGIDSATRDVGATTDVQAAVDIRDTVGQAAKLAVAARRPRDCFLVNPITATNLRTALREVEADGTPIVNIDQPLDASHPSVRTYIGTDNVQAGALAADALASSLRTRGARVAVVGGLTDDVTSRDRVEGFRRRAGALGLQVVVTVAADWEFARARAVGLQLIRGQRELAGFFAANDVMALGLAQAARDAASPGMAIVGVDGILDALRAVADGTLTATVSQYPYVIGRMGLEACVAAARGQRLPRRVDAPLAVITVANATAAIQRFPKPTNAYDNPFVALLAEPTP